MTVDPKVYALAEDFVADTVKTIWLINSDQGQYDALVQRAAEAMQLAIEQECDAIREELQT